MPKRLLIIHPGEGQETFSVACLGQTVEVRRLGCRGDVDLAQTWVADYDGHMEAIALEGLPAQLTLGPARVTHPQGLALAQAAHLTPVVDGRRLRDGLERWGVTLADRAQPGIFAEKRILMVPGLNHAGLAHALARHSAALRYADPLLFFGLPQFPGVGYGQTLDQVAGPTLEQLKDFPFRRLLPPPGQPHLPRSTRPFVWADVLAGDIGAIRRYAPADLRHKTVVVETATEADLADLQARGATTVITLMPDVNHRGALGQFSAAALEGLLTAVQADGASLSENTYLDLIASLDWAPHIRVLQPSEQGVNRFAFVIHPLHVGFIHQHPWFRWTRYLPDDWVEAVAAHMPPLYLSRITGAQSPATGQKVEGILLSLAATPRQMMQRGERATYQQLNQAARMAERLGARIMGLGAFTSVVGDAGITVAHEADIAITSGNSLTVAATLEAAKQAVLQMGAPDLTSGKAMVVGATGSIGAVCARLLAQAIHKVVLVSVEPEKLIDLKHRIQRETPGAEVTIATRADDLLGDCDLVVTATSAFGQRVIDLTECKPGAVICDVARPPDINPAEAALRPDLLVIESGEVLIPGEVDFGYDIGLPPRTSYACLAETCLLAMEGRFEDYTLGRNIEMERVKEVYRLFKKHGFQLAGLRSFGRYLTEAAIAERRARAEALRQDPESFRRLKAAAKQQLAQLPVMAKGVAAHRRPAWLPWIWAGGLAMGSWLVWRRLRRNA